MRHVALSAACVMALIPGASIADALHDARTAVDARQFDVAPPLFESMLAQQPDNSDLLIGYWRRYVGVNLAAWFR